MLKRILLSILAIFIAGFLIPADYIIPVKGATSKDYNSESFWYYPWGKSGTHKGVDVFAKKHTDVLSSEMGIVLYAGYVSRGGNFVITLGPKWRMHYYAHLEEIYVSRGDVLTKGEKLGSVGDSGNAKGKAPHLHYSMITLAPYPWRIDTSVQGWKKMFYLNPITSFE